MATHGAGGATVGPKRQTSCETTFCPLSRVGNHQRGALAGDEAGRVPAPRRILRGRVAADVGRAAGQEDALLLRQHMAFWPPEYPHVSGAENRKPSGLCTPAHTLARLPTSILARSGALISHLTTRR